MARAADQFRASDVTFWGIAALASGALAVLSANIGGLIPQDFLAGLHASRLQGATVTQLRTQLAALETETEGLQRENTALTTRFELAERETNEAVQRLATLEATLPDLQAQVAQATLPTPEPEPVDTTAVTASIDERPPSDALTFEADGGTVVVRHSPLEPQAANPDGQPMPAVPAAAPDAVAANPDLYGIAVGPVVMAEAAPAVWRDLNDKVGMLLFGLAPLLAEQPDQAGMRIVAGPLADNAEAQQLCTLLAPVNIPCRPVPFVGEPLPN